MINFIIINVIKPGNPRSPTNKAVTKFSGIVKSIREPNTLKKKRIKNPKPICSNPFQLNFKILPIVCPKKTNVVIPTIKIKNHQPILNSPKIFITPYI